MGWTGDSKTYVTFIKSSGTLKAVGNTDLNEVLMHTIVAQMIWHTMVRIKDMAIFWQDIHNRFLERDISKEQHNKAALCQNRTWDYLIPFGILSRVCFIMLPFTDAPPTESLISLLCEIWDPGQKLPARFPAMYVT